MDVSENSGTPTSSILIGVFHYKPSILGYHYFWKHLYVIRANIAPSCCKSSATSWNHCQTWKHPKHSLLMIDLKQILQRWNRPPKHLQTSTIFRILDLDQSYSFCLLVDIQAPGKTCLPFTSGYVSSRMPWVGQIYLTWHDLKHPKRHVGSLPLCRIFVPWNVGHFKTSMWTCERGD